MSIAKFCEKHDLDFYDFGYLGKGDFGTAWVNNHGKVLKETKSKSEYDIAKKLLTNPYPNLVEVYAVDKIDGMYYILMEELDTNGVEDEFYTALAALETQGLGITEVGYFDEEEYGDIDMDFLDQVYNVILDCNKAGIQNPDIRAENLGYSGSVLKAFDLMERV